MRRLVASIRVCTVFAVTAASAGAQPNRLSGLYLQRESTSRGEVWHYYYFWPEGHVCERMPKGGLDPAPDFAAVSARSPKDCGTYTLGGGQLRLQTGDAKQQKALKITNVSPSGFILAGLRTIRVPTFPEGATLSGTWTTTLILGVDYRDETFTFHPDGTFTYEERPLRAVGAPPVRIQGRYQLGGNTLRVMGRNTSQVLSIHPVPNETHLGIDGNVMRKSK